MNKKFKKITKSAVKKTGVFMKMANKKAGKAVKAIKKEWKKEQPQRDQYKKEIKIAAEKAGKKGLKIFNKGLKNSIKIGGDVADVIKKDLKEIYKNNK